MIKVAATLSKPLKNPVTRDPFGCVKHHPFDWQYKMFPEGKWKCKLYSAKWKKNVCTLLKDLLHIPIYPFCGRDGAFAPPPPSPLPPTDGCPIKLPLFHSLLRKSTQGLDRLMSRMLYHWVTRLALFQYSLKRL